MAGDWIKWGKGFLRKPEIVAIANALDRPRSEVAAGYMQVAEWLDSEGQPDDPEDVDSDITIEILSRNARDKRHALLSHLDEISGVTEFGEALENVGWVALTDTAIVFKRATRHNTETAKRRALAAKRQRRKRAGERAGGRHAKSVTRVEERREEKGNAATQHKARGGFDLLIEKWNALSGVASCQKATPKRVTAYRARVKEAGWLDSVDAALAKVAASEFCKGAGDRGWRADVDWFLRPDTITKLMEGKYDGKPKQAQQDRGRYRGGNAPDVESIQV